MSYQLKRILTITGIVVGIVILIFIIGILIWKGLPTPNAGNQSLDGKKTIEKSAPATGDLIKDVKDDSNREGSASQVVTFQQVSEDGSSATEIEAILTAEDSNPIAVETGKVLTRDGQGEANNTAIPGNVDAPLQSAPVNPDELSAAVTKIVFSAGGVEPNSFKAKAGQAVALSVTASENMEVFKFQSPLLSAVAIGLMRGETRVINFNAPAEKGEYVFYSDIPGRKEITGKMIVE